MRRPIVRIVAIACWLLAAGPAAAESLPSAAGQPTLEMLAEHLAELDRQLRRRFGRPVAEPGGERLRRQLRLVEGWAWQLEPAERAEVLDGVRALERLASDLEERPEPGPGAASPAAALLPQGEGGVPIHDACADAWPIGPGTFTGDSSRATPDGGASCGLTEGSPDVWFRVEVPPGEPPGSRFFADAGGFDTVLSVHSACPGTAANELACNDNTGGLGSSVAFAAGSGEVLLRLGGFAAAAGPWQLRVGLAGVVSGTVTDAAGTPLPGQPVRVSNRFYDGASGTTDSQGRYEVAGLAAGEYFAVASGADGYVGELYGGRSCPGGRCEVTKGKPIEVELNRVTEGIDFALDLGGAISGTVTDTGGAPLPSIRVEVVFEGDRRGTAGTDARGLYSIRGLAAGAYFVKAENLRWQNEVYDGVPCPVTCDVASGTPVAVSLGATVSGVDFVLDRPASISGTVTQATGDPIRWLRVKATDADGFYGGSGHTDAAGRYTIGLREAGTYRVLTDGFFTYRDELYDDVPCHLERCDLGAGTPVSADLDADTPGIDFALEHLGSIAGTVTDAVTGAPIPSADVVAETADDLDVDPYYASTNSGGRYRLEGLVSGSYRVRTETDSHRDELHGGAVCEAGDCDQAAAEPVAVRLAETTSGVDFSLLRLGSIAGAVTDAATGDPLGSLEIEVIGRDGSLCGRATTDAAGRYAVESLAAGAYFVRVLSESPAHQGELYDGVPCPGARCDPADGRAVAVAPGVTASGIDFALERPGAIHGTVRSAATADPLPGWVYVRDAAGLWAGGGLADAAGRYAVEGLGAGEHFVIASADRHGSQVYEGRACIPGSCDVLAGKPVAVSLGAATAGIDFRLERLGSVGGTVTDAVTGAPVGDVEVEVGFATFPHFARTARTDPAGAWTVYLESGTYVALADGPDGTYLDQIYDGLYCERLYCGRSIGTAITVDGAAAVTGIDFRLERGGSISGTVREARRGEPIHQTDILVWDADRLVSSARTDGLGRYVVDRLPQGDYVVAAVSDDHHPELYDDLPCPQESCDALADTPVGTPVAVRHGAVTAGVDFELTSVLGPVCRFADDALCLQRGRFRLEAEWRTASGATGRGVAEPLTRDTGTFWFFSPDNVELMVKVLDACVAPYDRFWVFAGGLTDVEVTLTVTDTLTGDSRSYFNPLGSRYLPVRDTGAFATCGADAPTGLGAAVVSEEPSALAIEARSDTGESPRGSGDAFGGLAECYTGGPTLCLDHRRFDIRAFWETETESGHGQAVQLTDDSGYFWFFDERNAEVVVKVVDACELAPFHNYWVYAAGLTDVRVTLRVLDKESGEVREWVHPLGTAFQPILETGSFRLCP